MLDVVKRILKGYLLIGMCTIVQRYHLLHGFEVEEVERVGDCVKEIP